MSQQFINRGQEYLSRGWSCVPVLPGNKKPAIPWSEFQRRLPTMEEIINWERQFPNAGWAIVTGRVSNLIVVDADGEEGKQSLVELGLSAINTPTVETPGGGVHMYFQCDGCFIRNSVKRLKGLDIRGEGGLVVAPDSIHFNGGQYKWLI